MDQDSLYKVYVVVDDNGRILDINSSGFVPPDWGIEIDAGESDKYHHAQRHYLDGPTFTRDKIPRYKLVDGKPVERTPEEIQADRDAMPLPPPTEQEQLRADIDFLASMQGVTL